MLAVYDDEIDTVCFKCYNMFNYQVEKNIKVSEQLQQQESEAEERIPELERQSQSRMCAYVLPWHSNTGAKLVISLTDFVFSSAL